LSGLAFIGKFFAEHELMVEVAAIASSARERISGSDHDVFDSGAAVFWSCGGGAGDLNRSEILASLAALRAKWMD